MAPQPPLISFEYVEIEDEMMLQQPPQQQQQQQQPGMYLHPRHQAEWDHQR